MTDHKAIGEDKADLADRAQRRAPVAWAHGYDHRSDRTAKGTVGKIALLFLKPALQALVMPF